MKTVLQLLFVMLLFGGAAAGGTLFWQQQQAALEAANRRAEAAEAKAAEHPLADLKPAAPKADEVDPKAADPKPEPPVAVRPPYVEGAEEASRLVVVLNQRLRAAEERERKLGEREEVLQLIFSDIRAEQAELHQRRAQLAEEFRQSTDAVQDKLKASEEERDLLQRELKSLNRSPSSTTPSLTPPAAGETDAATLKRLGAIYDAMPSDVVAEVFQQLAKSQREDDIVELLRTMKDRQAAKVLGAIAATDAVTAASLTQKLKLSTKAAAESKPDAAP